MQTVRVREPLLWRRRGWVRVEVDVAGYAASQRRGAGDHPGAAAGRAARVRAGPDRPGARCRAADRRRAGPAPGPLAGPAVGARRLAVGLDGRHLVAASGILTTTTDVVPLGKVQSLRVHQGPWQRRLGLASVHADTAGRRLTGAVAAGTATRPTRGRC